MRNKILVGLSVVVATGIAASSSANATGAGASLRANMNIPVKTLATNVGLRPIGIRRSLRARGYYNIHFTDRIPPVYRVTACRNGRRFGLRLNHWGSIRRVIRLGWCDGGGYDVPRIDGLSFPEIRHKLRNRGYYNIRFTDRRLPGYRARACKNGKRFVLWLNRWGRIMDRDRRGWCGYGSYYGPRHRPYVRYEGPGISITLGKGRRY